LHSNILMPSDLPVPETRVLAAASHVRLSGFLYNQFPESG
jgi:hypothetical protein